MGNKKDRNNISYPSPLTSQAKDSKSNHLTQEQIVSIALADKPKTRREIEIETGVHTNSLDWFVNDLMKSDVVFIASYGKCPITGSEGVQFVTSNPDYRPKPTFIQKTLF